MKITFKAKLITALVLGLGISLAMAPGALAANDLTFPETTYFYLSGVPETLTVQSGGVVDSVTVGTTTVDVTLGSGGGLTLKSPSRYIMTASPAAVGTGSCEPAQYVMTLASATTQTVTVTTSSTVCSTGGGGGGGGVVLATPSPSPSASASPTPSASPSASPSPSALPSPSASPSPSPSALPAPIALVPIPVVPANPTTAQIQAAITAILNNINYFRAELAKLQAPAQAFTQDLFYGLWNNADVKRLQAFLISKGYLTGVATGNYYIKTVEAVKDYQAAKGITPVSGRFGPKTRTAVNSDLGL